MSDAGDHLREAANRVRDVKLGHLIDARVATGDDEVEDMIRRVEERLADLEPTLYDIAEKADAAAEDRPMSDDSKSGIYQYCITPGCSFTVSWNGGSAGDDPSLPHLMMNPDHTVRSGVHDGHKELFEAQKSGEMDVTEDTDTDQEVGG